MTISKVCEEMILVVVDSLDESRLKKTSLLAEKINEVVTSSEVVKVTKVIHKLDFDHHHLNSSFF
jgi:uncharacterized membrane-anchored protein